MLLSWGMHLSNFFFLLITISHLSNLCCQCNHLLKGRRKPKHVVDRTHSPATDPQVAFCEHKGQRRIRLMKNNKKKLQSTAKSPLGFSFIALHILYLMQLHLKSVQVRFCPLSSVLSLRPSCHILVIPTEFLSETELPNLSNSFTDKKEKSQKHLMCFWHLSDCWGGQGQEVERCISFWNVQPPHWHMHVT